MSGWTKPRLLAILLPGRSVGLDADGFHSERRGLPNDASPWFRLADEETRVEPGFFSTAIKIAAKLG